MRRGNPQTNSPTALRLRAMPTEDNAKRLESVGAKTASNRTTEGEDDARIRAGAEDQG